MEENTRVRKLNHVSHAIMPLTNLRVNLAMNTDLHLRVPGACFLQSLTSTSAHAPLIAFQKDDFYTGNCVVLVSRRANFLFHKSKQYAHCRPGHSVAAKPLRDTMLIQSQQQVTT